MERMVSALVSTCSGLLLLRGSVSSNTRRAVSGESRFTVSRATPARRQSWPKDQSFMENVPS
jgi:hypothetical protein